MLNFLIVTGATSIPLDGVRKLSNLGTGNTGHAIAIQALKHGHQVHLLTSNPSAIENIPPEKITLFDTYDDLRELLQKQLALSKPDIVIMAAAISDYGNPSFHDAFHSTVTSANLRQKVPSEQNELWIRLTKLPKIIDMIRTSWAFQGILVKFKLEADLEKDALLEIAKKSRKQSDADLIVANRLEDYATKTWIIDRQENIIEVPRNLLPEQLVKEIESLSGI